MDDDPPPRRETPSGKLDQAPHAATTAAHRPRARPPMPEGVRVHQARNLVVLAARKGGLSARLIAKGLRLSRATVADILDDPKAHYSMRGYRCPSSSRSA